MELINFDGLLIGIATFLIIGLFHPVVVKAEYYWGTKCWWIFLVLGIVGTVASLLIKCFCFGYMRRIRFLLFLDDKGSFRAGRTCTERLVS